MTPPAAQERYTFFPEKNLLEVIPLLFAYCSVMTILLLYFLLFFLGSSKSEVTLGRDRRFVACYKKT
jgi:hypothetical protein